MSGIFRNDWHNRWVEGGATNFTKLQFTLVLKCGGKKFAIIFKESQNFLLKKLSLSSKKIRTWDPGSGKNLFRIPGSKRHRIPDPDPQHCLELSNKYLG